MASLFVIVTVFWVENNDQHLSEACHLFLSCPRLYSDLAMPPCWAHLARRPALVCLPCLKYDTALPGGKVVAAPDLTSHPSFCLMPDHWGCDDWKHIYSQYNKGACRRVFLQINPHTDKQWNDMNPLSQANFKMSDLPASLMLPHFFNCLMNMDVVGNICCFLSGKTRNKQGFHNKEICLPLT